MHVLAETHILSSKYSEIIINDIIAMCHAWSLFSYMKLQAIYLNWQIRLVSIVSNVGNLKLNLGLGFCRAVFFLYWRLSSFFFLFFKPHILYWCFLHLNRTENSIHTTRVHAAMILVMMFAKCSIDLMNTAISGKENSMKGKYNPHHGVSNFNYLSGECIFTCLSKQFWPPMMSKQSV